MTYDVAIIGAGVVGGMIARELSRYRLSVCVLEKDSDVAMGATRANSAIVHAGFDAAEGTLKARLNVEGSKRMPQVVSELDVKYRRNGSLVVGFDDRDREEITRLYQRGINNGVEGLEILDARQLREKEPNISPEAMWALYAPSGAIVCPYELTVASIGNAMDNGADLLLRFAVRSIRWEDDAYVLNDTLRARYVVNASGVFSDNIARLVGDDSFAIHPRKGEYIVLDKDCESLVSHTIFGVPSPLGKGILVTPTVDGNILLGPTSREVGDKEDTATTLEGLAEIRQKTRHMVPSVPLNKAITSFAGLRASGDTGDFILRSYTPHFIHAAGIESPGLSAAPAIARFVAELLRDNGLALVEKESFTPYRKSPASFRALSMEEKNAVIRENPLYGKIVCRCEGISEGEIVQAIRQNPRSLTIDAVKRRVRGGMGRCQGGFCGPTILEILAREGHMPLQEITKAGGESVILTGKTKDQEEGVHQ